MAMLEGLLGHLVETAFFLRDLLAFSTVMAF